VPESLPLQAAGSLATLPASTPGTGMWRYAPAIPVAPIPGLSMGEGGTPLVASGLTDVWCKLEFVSPTGSFKDRGAAVLVAAARARAAPALIADSSGNAGSAIAAYAARAGLPCHVFVPAATSTAKQAQIRAFGAALELVPGDRTATAEAAADAVRAGEAMYASHVHDPLFLQGTKTFAYELWEQLPAPPDALVIPAGNGTLLLGAAIGFAELHAAGLIARRPALIAVQAAHCAPLAAAWWSGSGEPAEVVARPTAAEGIAIPRPARGRAILEAVRESGGCVLAVPEAAITPAAADLAARGLLVEPTAAVPWAAVRAARGDGPGSDEGRAWTRARQLLGGSTVVPLCGSGLKTAHI
jgi:threonine synthase